MFENSLKKLSTSESESKLHNVKLKNYSKFLLTLFLFLFTITVHATVYYVSNSGNDSNQGTSSDKPWKSLSKVNSFNFKGGDQILFKRGDEWTGTITVSAAGSSGNPIVYGAYGSGEKPKIYGSEVITGWKKHSGNIYKASFSGEVNQLFIGEDRMKAARHPNSGFMFISKTSGSTSLTADDLNGSIKYDGAKWFGRTNYFTASLIDVKSSSSKTINLKSAPRFPLKAGLGFFLMNKLEFLDQPGEWFYDKNSKTVYLWTARGDSPENYTIRGSVHKDGFYLSNKDYVTIRDIQILHQSEKGIHLRNSDYITIEKNDFLNADGFGIYSLTDARNITISNNNISGVNHYGMYIRISHSEISDNTISNVALFDNIGLTGTGEDNFGGGIYLAGDDGNNKVRYNRVTEVGYAGILFGRQKNIIEYNFVKDVCLLKSDMGGIYTSWYNRNVPIGPDGSIIRYNIILNVKGEKHGYTSTRHLGEGIYVDESAKGVTVEHNTIGHVTNSGIKLHKNENSTVRNNTILDARQSIHVLHSSGSVKNKIHNNIMMAASDKDDYLQRQVLLHESSRNAISNNNTYVNPYASNGIFRSGSKYYNFNKWQKVIGQEKNSTVNVTPIGSGEKEVLFFNDTKQDKTINLGSKKYKDVNGKTVTGTFVLKPFTSRILIGSNSGAVEENQAPVVSDHDFEMTSAKSAGDLIGQVVASDRDAGQSLRYSIISGNSDGMFAIDATTGKVTAKKTISVATNKTINLEVEVKDNASSPLTARALVTISIRSQSSSGGGGVVVGITDFNVPATATTLTIPVSIQVSGGSSVTGYKLTETSAKPSANDAGWKSAAPAEYTFSQSGSRTLYAWVKDASGNVSSPAIKTVVINSADGLVEYITICEGDNYMGWTQSGTYTRTEKSGKSVQNPGSNLIAHGDFKSGNTGWSVWGASGYSLSMASDSKDFISAPASMKLVCTSTGSSISALQFTSSVDFSVQKGKEYELSFYAKGSTNFNLNKMVVMKRKSPYTHYGSFKTENISISREWKKVVVRFTATHTASDASFRMYLGNTLPKGQSVNFDDVVLAEVGQNNTSEGEVITTHLTVSSAIYTTENVEIKNGNSYNGWKTSGVYKRTLMSVAGCDSIVATNLKVGEGSGNVEYVTICEGDNYMGWTQSGTYTRTEKSGGSGQNSGSNLIKHGDFNSGITGWSVWGASGYSLSMLADSKDYISAPASMKLSCTSTGSSASSLQFTSSVDFSVQKGKEYELSFYAKGSTNFILKKMVLMKRKSPYTHYGRFETGAISISKEWKKIVVKFTATQSASDASFRMYLGNGLPKGQSVNFDDIILAEAGQNNGSEEKVITTHLTVNTALYTTEDVEIQEGGSYRGWKTSGVYERTLVSAAGCDSIVTTNVVVLGSMNGKKNGSAIDSYPVADEIKDDIF